METREALVAQEMKKVSRYEGLRSKEGAVWTGITSLTSAGCLAILKTAPPLGPLTTATILSMTGASLGITGTVLAGQLLAKGKLKKHRENLEYLQNPGKLEGELTAIKNALEVINEYGYEHFRGIALFRENLLGNGPGYDYRFGDTNKSPKQLIEHKKELEKIQKRIDKLENNYTKKHAKEPEFTYNVPDRHLMNNPLKQEKSIMQALKRVRAVERARNIPGTLSQGYNKLKGSKNSPTKFTNNGKYLR